MKRKLLQLFAVCMAIVMAIPIANAAQITYSVKTTSEWEKAGTYNGAKTIAVSNNMLYLLLQPTTETTIAYVGQNQKWTTFESGYGTWAHGFAFDNDDAGNIVMQGYGPGSTATKLVVYPAGATSNSSKKEISIPTSYRPEGRSDYMRIQGNINSGKCYVWFVPQSTQKIFRLNIEDGVVIGKTEWTHTLGNASSTELAYMLDDGRIFFHHRKGSPNYAYLLTVPANGGNVTSSEEILSGDGASNLTSDVFNIQGTYLYAYNAGNTAQDIRFNVKNLATGKDIATNIAPFNGKKTDEAGTISYLSEFNSVGTTMRPIKVNVNTVDLYCYTPEHGASVYRVQANIVAESVNSVSASLVEGTNDNIKVSWTKPTNDVPTSYAVSYSSNGGSSWSDAVVTNNLTHTFTNLTPGTYIFKVIPYYEQYLTYGGEKKSNNIEVVNYTNPVTNLQVQTSIASPYSAVVNWDAPTEGVPSKYAISYSIDGGSTWSTPVEETAKSHIYSNIAPGQYIFKVVPYYNGTPGEATAQSATVYGITAYVTNVNVAYNNNKGNSIVVSWDAPESEVAPDKYQVCYSTNGGTSWSTPIETQNLTYIFDNLAIGTYQFKVTPVFNGYAGEGALSENINALAPTGYSFIVTKKWAKEGTLTNNGDKNTPAGKSIAVSNDVLYVSAMNQYGTISRVHETKFPDWPNFDSDYTKGNFGYGMDNDDEGNIVVAVGSLGTATPKKFAVYPAGATSSANKKEFTLSDDHLPGARFDYMGVQGNIYSGTGYIWVAPNGTKNIKRIKIENKSGVPTSTEVTTWTHSLSNNNTEVIIRPLEDGRIYYHCHQGSCRVITLPEGGGDIPSANMETISLTTAQNDNFTSDAIILKGNVLNIRNAGLAAQDISFEVYNVTAKNYATYNGKQVITPFDGVRTDGTENPLSGLAKYASMIRAIKRTNEDIVDVYVYSLYHGASCYQIGTSPIYTITGAIQSLDYEYSPVETEEGIRQDIVLTWTAPKDAMPTNYKIYRNGSLLKTVDASTLTYTDQNVGANYTYKVVPYFAGITEDASLGLEVTTTEVETILFAPKITEVRNYDGYSIVEIFWQMPSINKVRPAYYNIYRNGVLLETGITQYNFIDDQLPKISENVEYTYTVEAVYSATYDNTTRTSQGKDVMVKARDWSLSGYLLQDIYNIPVSPAIGNLPNNFTNFEYYRQGHFYNGSWYIAQRADNLAKKDDANYTASDKYTEIESGVDGTTGGVVTIKATNESDVRAGFTGKPITSEAFASVGLAIDDAGNIFVRHNNDSNADMATTAPAKDQITGLPVNWLGYISDGFTRRITRGAIYKHKGDGTYETEPIVLNLNALWLSNDWINTMAFSYENSGSGDKNGQVTGRSDYYSMYGDVMSAEGGFLIISPSWTRTIFKIKIANGEYVNHETHQIDKYQSAEGEVKVKTGTENYGFKIDGRNAWMAQIRSNGYFGIHGEEDHAGEGEEAHEHETHAIFVADSRINNTGGTSIVAFDNKKTNVNDGDAFLITPVSMYSRNQGDFIVTRGKKSNVGDAAADATFMPPMPVAQMKQTAINENIATNANGNWFHAEIGTYTAASGKEEECVYIYQYVPGIRFAKYRLIPDLNLPVVSPTLDISTAYNEGETEITHFNGRSTWQRPDKFALTDPDNASVWIKSYSFELLDAKGNVVYSDEVPEAKDADGNIVMEYEFDYVVDKGIDNLDNCDLDFQTYTARIAVNYEFKNGEIQQSAFNYALDDNDYPALPASELGIHVFKANDRKEAEWAQDENGEWVIAEKIVDAYRVDLDFSKPNFGNLKDEPVSYYTIRVGRTINREVVDYIDITDFHLHKGKEVVNGIEQAILDRDKDGNVIPSSQIPGTYDFDNNKAPFGDGSVTNCVLTWHHVVDNGSYNESASYSRSTLYDEPDKWQYIVVAHYAAENPYIKKSEPVSVSANPEEGLIETGVEVVGDNEGASLKIYPVPATTTITIKSTEAINEIVIYNEAGVEVMNEVGDGENITTVNIENLATGFYFVRVNNQEPVKIAKK